MRETLVPMFFPILDANLTDVRLTYSDNKYYVFGGKWGILHLKVV